MVETKKDTGKEVQFRNIFFVLLFITIGTSGKNQQKKDSKDRYTKELQ